MSTKLVDSMLDYAIRALTDFSNAIGNQIHWIIV